MSEPRYTIVLPVHNGGDYVRLCVASILGQTFTDFEFAILENASTDGTAEWLASLTDPRIKLYPSHELLPPRRNWMRTLEIPKREFITFIGHDDMLAPNYLEEMDALTRKHPDAGLFQVGYQVMDQTGQRIRAAVPAPERESGSEFVNQFFAGEREAFVGAMLRAERFHEVGGFPDLHGALFADTAFILKAALPVDVATTPEEIFLCRQNPTSYSHTIPDSAWVTALHEYFQFLKEWQATDPAFARVFATYGPVYAMLQCRDRYELCLRHASMANRPLDPETLPRLEAALSLIAPDLVSAVRDSKEIRKLEVINRSKAGRLKFIAYKRLQAKFKSARAESRRKRAARHK